MTEEEEEEGVEMGEESSARVRVSLWLVDEDGSRVVTMSRSMRVVGNSGGQMWSCRYRVAKVEPGRQTATRRVGEGCCRGRRRWCWEALGV